MRIIGSRLNSLLLKSCYSFCVLIFLVLSTGCVSQKPIPYRYSEPKPPNEHGQSLILLPTEDMRGKKDRLDTMLKMPACVDEALSKELEGAGLFKHVHAKSDAGEAGLKLKPQLFDLRWEVPAYKRIAGTAFAVSMVTGGIGGLVYSSTDTDVLGHARIRFTLTKGNQVILDKDYIGLAQDRKTKMVCDTPATYREMAAEALRHAVEQFKTDLSSVILAQSRETLQAAD